MVPYNANFDKPYLATFEAKRIVALALTLLNKR